MCEIRSRNIRTLFAESGPNTIMEIRMEAEIWKPIPIAPAYEASSLGQIRMIGRHPLAQRTDPSGRVVVALVDSRYKGRRGLLGRGMRTRTFGVAQLMLHAFQGPPSAFRKYAGYADGDPANLTIENLRWVTWQELHPTNPRTGKPQGLPKCAHCGQTIRPKAGPEPKPAAAPQDETYGPGGIVEVDNEGFQHPSGFVLDASRLDESGKPYGSDG